MTGFNDRLGLLRGEDGSSVVLEAGPEHQVAAGTIHFAVLATLAEVAAAQSVGAAVVPASVHTARKGGATGSRMVPVETSP